MGDEGKMDEDCLFIGPSIANTGHQMILASVRFKMSKGHTFYRVDILAKGCCKY